MGGREPGRGVRGARGTSRRNPTVLIWSVPTFLGIGFKFNDFIQSQSHRADLVSSDVTSLETGEAVEAFVSQSHRADLVSSDIHKTTGWKTTRKRRNPTVLIWSVPTAFILGVIAAYLILSQSHRADLVSSDRAGQHRSVNPAEHRRNPTVLIWSVPTLALPGP
jgi:hypothetical protein